ncbi:MAG: BatD family protein [Leeuwenhoekiella sp.]
MKPLPFFLTLFLVATTAWAQDVKFDASVSTKQLGINERVRVDFEMNKDGDNFDPPSFQGFTVISGPYQSVSRQWVNGKSSFSKVYSYNLQPNARGKITIGQAEVTIEGTVYKTVPVEVDVTGAVDRPGGDSNPVNVAADNIHLVAEVSKTDPYLNEAFTVEYKLYVSPQTAVEGWNELDAPKYTDFWSQSIDEKQFKVYDGAYNGQPYRYVILRRTVLYPQKTGELTIEPLALNINVEVPTNRRDFFGGRITRPAKLTVAAKNRTINVKPLPQDGKPLDFTGAVGNFSFSVDASKTKLNAGEALDLSVEAQGRGNLKLFNLPAPNLPSTLEVYEPQNEDDIKVNSNGMTGIKKNRYTIVPQQKGKYPIPPIRFSYFNPATEQYETISSPELLIDVEGGAALASASDGTVNKIPVNPENQFHYIQSKANLQPMDQDRFFGTTTFWSIVGAPLLMIPLIIAFGRKRRAYRADVEGNRLRKANRLARKYLSEAKKNLGEQKPFYLALEKSMHNFLKARLNIQTSDMSKERIRTLLQQRGIDEVPIEEFLAVLSNCEFARYTPSSTTAMEKDYDRASQVISTIDKQL